MGADLKEIVDIDQVGRVFTAAALGMPLLCLLLGWWYGRRSGMLRRGVIYGALVGALGPLNWVLWTVYNRIEDALGLDSVRALLINLGIFLVVGAVVGVGAGVGLRRIREAPVTDSGSDKLE